MDRKNVDPIPDQFAGYEEAASFWDEHDTTDYLDQFVTVEATTELRRRHYDIELVVITLCLASLPGLQTAQTAVIVPDLGHRET